MLFTTVIATRGFALTASDLEKRLSFGASLRPGPVSPLPLRRQIPPFDPANELTLGYLYRIYRTFKDAIDLRNHLHRCVFDRSFITA